MPPAPGSAAGACDRVADPLRKGPEGGPERGG